MNAPWILGELHAAGILDSPWRVTWVAVRGRNYLCELAHGCLRLIAKYPRPGEGISTTTRLLANEYYMLERLESLAFEQAPEPVAYLEASKVWVQKALPGRPLTGKEVLARLDLRNAILDMLVELSRHSQGRLERKELLAELRQPAPGELATLPAERLAGSLEAVVAHNDLNPTNLLWDGTRLASVDWTWGSQRGMPCFDWFDLIAHSAFERVGCWQQVGGLLGDSNRLRELALQGALRLTNDADVSACLLKLYLVTRLANLRRRNGDPTEG